MVDVGPMLDGSLGSCCKARSRGAMTHRQSNVIWKTSFDPKQSDIMSDSFIGHKFHIKSPSQHVFLTSRRKNGTT